MTIEFDRQRWDKIKHTYDRWWAGKLDRPVIQVELTGRDPGRAHPGAPLLSQDNCTDFTVSAEALIDRNDYELSKIVFLADAFPWVNLAGFGPGIIAGFIGAEIDNSTGRVWFKPIQHKPIEELEFTYDAENVWLCRIKDICRAAVKKWQGNVLVAMPDLGGVFDLLAVFRTTENLLLDLYDKPDEVKRLIWQLHDLWHRFYYEIEDILKPVNPGWSDWAGIYSSQKAYMLQSDFSYMISPEMFNSFVLPEIEQSCHKLTNTFYHLDGPGQLRHLDSLLQIDKLKGIQWVPGEGNSSHVQWPEVYSKIRDGGKLVQLRSRDFQSLETIINQLGSGKGIQQCTITGSIDDYDYFEERLKRFGSSDNLKLI